ncbi:hypothetical protein GX50_00208 [[Emmonsia] crescens]|uniref:Uncharacterized protein n=1 Tax=[Emmonsia] crescens TaxID=73230 RepID=A0A2B7ZVE5_9EURO|nr:hypothetical protein GX50_00208 [Emmonsia crescens]
MKLLKEWSLGNLSKEENYFRAIGVGSRNFELSISNVASINHAAAQIGKSMPESFTGEHSARMKALAGGLNPLEDNWRPSATWLISYRTT